MVVEVKMFYDIKGICTSSSIQRFNDIKSAIEFAKEKQKEFCKKFRIRERMQFEHEYGENEIYSAFNVINGYGGFIAENKAHDLLYIKIVEKLG